MGHYNETDRRGTSPRSFSIEYIATDPMLPEGFYWASCFPSPSIEHGPFPTYRKALKAAQGAGASQRQLWIHGGEW